MVSKSAFPKSDPGYAPPAARFEPSLFELRNYATAPGRRRALIDMFEQRFLDAYEAGGARVMGTFEVVGDEDRWVWMRAFRDAPSRGEALANFYSSPQWMELKRPANATIMAVSYAMLLRQWSGGAFADPKKRLAPGAKEKRPAVIAVDIFLTKAKAEEEFARAFDAEAMPHLAALKAAPFASFVTDRRENFYPRQRVRKASAFVTMTRFENMKAHDAFRARLADSAEWRRGGALCIEQGSAKPAERLVLRPTARSSVC
jgi:hypothetical protein